MIIHETRTRLEPAEVYQRARSFFALAGTPAAAFADPARPGFQLFRIEVGEMVIAAAREGTWTCVRGSASRGGHLLSRFLTLLGEPLDARQTTHRHGARRVRGADVETFARLPREVPTAA